MPLKRFFYMAERDYYIENEKAFTHEGNILVTNVQVVDIGMDDTIESLKELFGKFGEILELTIDEKNDFCKSRCANILFKSPFAAAKALTREPPGYILEANDRWLQPLLYDNDLSQPTYQSKYITDLDDDTLLIIMSQLRLRDQLAAVCCHDRFVPAFEMFARRNLKSINSKDLVKFSPWQLQQLFILIGNYIKKFCFVYEHDKQFFTSLCKALTAYCQSFESLTAARLSEMDAHTINSILAKNTNLKELHFYSCMFGDRCSDAISSLPQLEKLTLTYHHFMTGEDFTTPNLKELNIIDGEKMSVDQIRDWLLRMPALTTLRISDTRNILTPIVENLPDISKNLEVLSLNCVDASYACLSKLEKLKSVNFAHFGTKCFLPEFVRQRGHQIETLGIDCFYFSPKQEKHFISYFSNLRHLYYKDATDEYLSPLHALQKLITIDLTGSKLITNKGLLRLVENCCSLKHVNIEKTAINTDFALDLLKKVTRNGRENGQIKFSVHGCDIKKFKIPKEYLTEEISLLVKFDFNKSKEVNKTSKIFEREI